MKTELQIAEQNIKYRNRGFRCMGYGLVFVVIMLLTLGDIYFMIVSGIGISIFTILAFYFIFIKWDFTKE